MSKQPLKVISLKSENVKKLKAVEIIPNGNVIKISGANAQGKSSVLDSIAWALGGKNLIQEQPIRVGEKTASITLELGGEKTELKVKRTFTEKNSTLTIETAEGAKYGSPQKLLDEIIGNLSFDPLKFMQLKPADQLNQLKNLVEVPIDLDALDAKYNALFEERSNINREIKRLSAQIEIINIPSDCPTEEQIISELLSQIQTGIETNTANKRGRDYLAELKRQHTSLSNRIEEVANTLAELGTDLNELETTIEEQEDLAKGLADVDIDVLQSQMQNIEAQNQLARYWKNRESLKQSLQSENTKAENMNTQLNEIKQTKLDAITNAQFPVTGLGFGEQGITFNDLPLEQASSAEQLRVSLAIAMASNPTLRVIRISDASLLDSKSLALIEEAASDKGFQIWMEIVDESGKVGIFIEDGEVSAVN